MSHFLCLSTPPQISDETIVSAFKPRVRLTAATASAIGKLTCGKHEDWTSNIVWLGSDSFALIYKQPDDLAAALHALLQREDCREIRFMAHLFTGYIDTEEIEMKEQKRFYPEDLADVVENIELDVRYVLATRYHWEKP